MSDDNVQVVTEAPKKKITWTLILTVFMICFGSSFIFGYNMAVVNLPVDHIKCFMNEYMLGKSCNETKPVVVKVDKSNNVSLLISTKAPLPESSVDADFLYAQASTVFVVAGVIGAFGSGWLAEKLGRRNGLILNNCIMIVSGILLAITTVTKSVMVFYVGRFFAGINAGLTIGIASMYLMEIAPRHLRGAIGACHQLAVTLGITFGYVLTLTHTLNSKNYWALAVGSGAIPAIISLIMLPLFSPQSPRFLYLNKKNEDEARKSFVRFNDKDDVDVFIGELREEVEAAKDQEDFRFLQMFTTRELRMPLLIACLIQVMQQLSGINSVITYSSIMLKTAGIPDQYSQYCVLGIGVINVLATVASLYLIEKLGRRTLLLYPSVLLAISLVFLTIFVNLANSDNLTPETKKIFGIISVLFIFTYIIGFALGLGPIPGLIVAEIFRQETRAHAYSISQAVQWSSNFIVLMSYPSLNKAIGGYSFLPFLFIVVACWVFFFLFMTETKNKTFDEVAKDLAFGNIVVGKRTTKISKNVRYTKADHDEIDMDAS